MSRQANEMPGKNIANAVLCQDDITFMLLNSSNCKGIQNSSPCVHTSTTTEQEQVLGTPARN